MPFPTQPVLPLPAPAGLDQPLADQHSIHRRARRRRCHPASREHRGQPSGSPTGMLSAELADLGLDLGRHMMRARRRSMRPIRQLADAAILITTDPSVHALARHPEPSGDLSHRLAIAQHGHHCLVSLFHDAVRNEHGHLPGSQRTERRQPPSNCQASAGTDVNDHPKPCRGSAEPTTSSINRDNTFLRRPRHDSNMRHTV